MISRGSLMLTLWPCRFFSLLESDRGRETCAVLSQMLRMRAHAVGTPREFPRRRLLPPRLSLPRLPPPQIGSGRADGAGRLDWFWQSRLDLATNCTLVDQRKRRVHHCTESVQPENSLYRGRPAEPLEQSGEQPTVPSCCLDEHAH